MADFKDPIAYKSRKATSTFAAPRKEQATTGRFMDAGDTYGVGFKQPVGMEKVSTKTPIPQKAFACYPDEVVRG